MSVRGGSRWRRTERRKKSIESQSRGPSSVIVKGLIRDIDPDAYTKPKLSASTTEAKEAKKARREETVRRKAVQEEMSLIAMRVFENLLARESAENTIDGSSQFERASCDVPVDSD